MRMRHRWLLGGLLIATLDFNRALAAQATLPLEIEAAAINHRRLQQPVDSGPPVAYDVAEHDTDGDGVAEVGERLVFGGMTLTVAGQDERTGRFHTPPNLWPESRLYHTPFDPAYADRIELKRIPTGPSDEVVRSPNRAYVVGLMPPGRCGVVERRTDCQVDAPDVTVTISTERDYLLALQLRDHYPNFTISLQWVNEKLLFVRVWWGRILGTDLLLDVESARIVFQEMVNDGSLAFRQFQDNRPDR